jgi:hypothetical protein
MSSRIRAIDTKLGAVSPPPPEDDTTWHEVHQRSAVALPRAGSPAACANPQAVTSSATEVETEMMLRRFGIG